MSASFNKRIYTWPAFRVAITDVFGHMDELRRAARSDQISRAFTEKIMLAVTRVNGCRYCAYGHTRAALAMGVPEAEIRQIMSGDLDNFSDDEAVALAFAQHYAESACRPDPAAQQRLVDYYGLETAHDISAYLRMITFGNLYGNTFDALLSRLTWKPAPASSLWAEMGILLGVFVLVPVEMIKRLFRNRSSRSKISGLNPDI